MSFLLINLFAFLCVIANLLAVHLFIHLNFIFLFQLQEPVLLLGKDRFAGVDIRVRVRGGGHVAQIYGN